MSGTFSGVNTLQFTPDNKRCYAFSGSIGIGTSVQTLLEFSTNSEYIVATIGCCGPVNPADIPSGSNSLFRIYLNDVVIAQNKQGTATESQPTFSEQTIIIPPFSTVKIDNIDNSAAPDWKVQAYVTGTVHGTIEQFNLELNNE
jgi:hypothetical protein|tara:strand:+ start:31 stop:462 length:432 start_codon:yes stop_codon:yes gene_type:complete